MGLRPPLQTPRAKLTVETRINASSIQLKDSMLVCLRDVERIDVALRVVEVLTRLWVNAANSTDHFRTEQDVVYIDHLGEQIDTRLMIDAGVEEHVTHYVLHQRRTLQHVGQSSIAAPVIGHRTATVRDDETQLRKVAEQIAFDELHESRSVCIDVVGTGRMKVGIARGRHVDHRRYIELDH